MATDVPALLPIEGVPRNYAWGSPTAIPELLGVPADGRPVAELWFGAHPDDPSPAHCATLDELIAADPAGLLGADAAQRFGPHLPFLVKLLAADKALSIQVHPDLAQARAGFAREDAAGIARDAPTRTYRDPNHKPELICALTEFEALCGFRPVADTLRLLEAFAVAELAGVRAALAGPDGLRAAFSQLLTLPDPAPVVDAVTRRAAALIDDAEWSGPARAVLLAAGDFPGDVGAVVTLLLNHVRLQPGEAIFLAAGNVHAYLRGFGIEVMANSDNVLRCGLTPKHIDVEELLRITDFTPLAEPRFRPGPGESVIAFRPPVPDFAVTRVRLGHHEEYGWDVMGPTVVLSVGSAVVRSGTAELDLGPGRACFAPPDGSVDVRGPADLFVVTPGQLG